MTYLVYLENDFTLLKNEYFGYGDNVVVGYHDPHKAALFKTKKEAKAFASTFSLDTKIGKADEHFKLFENTDYVYRQIPLIDKKLNKKYNDEKADEVIKWWINYRNAHDFQVTYDVFETWPKLYSMCKHLWDVESYHNRDYSEKYHTFKIKTDRGGSFDEFKKEIDKVIDDVTFLQDGYKKLSIIDHELSQYECRYFLYKDENDCTIASTYYTYKKGTMKECFDYMKNHYYYV